MNVFLPEGTLKTGGKNYYGASFLADACARGEILEAVVSVCDAEHNLTVDLGSMQGIIPRCEGAVGITEGTTRDIALISRVGKSVAFTVTSLETDKSGTPYALLSRRAAQEKRIDDIRKNLKSGDILAAKITHLEPFGAFCDIGCGVAALLPIDAISVSRISHPSDRFKVGDNIRAAVKSVSEDGRVTLTHKELLGTWEENAALFSEGQTVPGIIRSVEDYGVFVELTPNLAGLAEPKENVSVGQYAGVYIKSILPSKMKVKLIIIDSFDSNYSNKIKYFFDGSHIDVFRYSPSDSEKQSITVFGDENL